MNLRIIIPIFFIFGLLYDIKVRGLHKITDYLYALLTLMIISESFLWELTSIFFSDNILNVLTSLMYISWIVLRIMIWTRNK